MGTFTLPLKEVIDLSHGDIGLNDYPIFDGAYRQHLNQKIIDHYWNQEIGMETISMFQFAMRRKMNEIMPLYNEHYKLSLITADPLSTVSIKSLGFTDGTTEGTANGTTNSTTKGNTTTNTTTEGNTAGNTVTDGTSSNESGSTAKSRTVASDTPQTQLNPNQDYATSMQDNISDSNATGSAQDHQNTATDGTESQTGTGTGTESQTGTGANQESQSGEHSEKSDNSTEGYQGHAPMLIFQARQALVNVDMMIIDELQSLFMLIWSTNDSFTDRNYPYVF